MSQRIVLGVFVLLAGLLGQGHATQAQGVEQLMVLPPKGWKVGYHEQRGTVEVTEIIPPDQTIEAWQDMLVVELIAGKPDKDVQTVLRERLEEIHRDCENVGAGEPQLSKENGYDTGVRAIACPRSQKWNKGEVSLFKVLLGNDRTYVVSRSWRSEPFEKQHVSLPSDKMEEWLTFMTQVTVCDPRDPAHPCPVRK